MVVRRRETTGGRQSVIRVYVTARAIARFHFPQMTEADLDQPAQRWDGTGLVDVDGSSVWEDFIAEAEAAIAALRAGKYLR